MAWLIILHVTLVDGLSKTSEYFLKIRIMQWLTELQVWSMYSTVFCKTYILKLVITRYDNMHRPLNVL